jgi:hypothetical protein
LRHADSRIAGSAIRRDPALKGRHRPGNHERKPPPTPAFPSASARPPALNEAAIELAAFGGREQLGLQDLGLRVRRVSVVDQPGGHLGRRHHP